MSKWMVSAIALGVVGCAVTADNGEPTEETSSVEQETQHQVNGKRLFERETFGGNGRTCETCHDKQGTVSVEDVQKRYRRDRHDPLFRPIDSDDGIGTNYSQLLADATVRVTLDLPANWSLAGDPSARTVTLRRAIPTTLNVPSFDSLFMTDGRFTTLQSQALGAVNAHAQPGRQPTAAELDAIAEHQQTNPFFSSPELRRFARGGPAPTLPQGRTASEKRGRLWYVSSAAGVCSHCHDGPMLNETNQHLLAPLPPGSRFFTAFVSELNKGNRPVFTFLVDEGGATPTVVQTPDPGRALVTGQLADLNTFRIPTLWGSAKTGPWFHDNSAKTLEDLAAHYSDYFQIVGLPALTAQDQKDIVAYLKLLD